MTLKLASAGAMLAAIAVILGAFGAHLLKSKIGAESLAVWETGNRYHFYHSLAIIAIAALPVDGYKLQLPVILLIAGIVLFSGSLYLLALNWLPKPGGIITPIGGLFFIAGWLFLSFQLLKK